MIEATKASEEMGRKLMEPFIDDAIKFLKLLKRADIEQLLCKNHK
jgi:hypothetical protein